MKKLKRILIGEDGVIYAWLAFLLPIFLLLLGLVADLAALYTLTGRVQSAVDSAGTSALSASLSEASIRDGGPPEVDPDKAKEIFLRLLRLELKLGTGMGPVEGSGLDGPLVLEKIEVVSAPPSITVSVSTPLKTTLLRFLVPEVRIPIHSQSILDQKRPLEFPG